MIKNWNESVAKWRSIIHNLKHPDARSYGPWSCGYCNEFPSHTQSNAGCKPCPLYPKYCRNTPGGKDLYHRFYHAHKEKQLKLAKQMLAIILKQKAYFYNDKRRKVKK